MLGEPRATGPSVVQADDRCAGFGVRRGTGEGRQTAMVDQGRRVVDGQVLLGHDGDSIAPAVRTRSPRFELDASVGRADTGAFIWPCW